MIYDLVFHHRVYVQTAAVACRTAVNGRRLPIKILFKITRRYPVYFLIESFVFTSIPRIRSIKSTERFEI